ncbi:MAG: alkyl hydroperoxide reductase [Thiotrichaceae bacterium]|nr:MAG: alkyl hydroperoxide reductase [Thiotrichaceae bacterium]
MNANIRKILFIIMTCIFSTISAAEIEPPSGIRHYEIGLAKNFNLTDIDGENFQLNSARGQWVFLHFWASWCGPCREEMPTLQVLADTFSDDTLKIVMVNTAEDEDTIFTFLSAINVDINSLLDVDGLVTEEWKPRGLPSTFLINPEGEVKYQAIGGRDWGKPVYINFIKQLVSN